MPKALSRNHKYNRFIKNMPIKNILRSRQFYLLAYKLLYDAIFLVLLVAFVSFIAQTIIPGLLSAHLSTLRIFVILIVLLMLTSLLGRKLDIAYTSKSASSKKSPRAALSVIFLFLLVGDSMLKFSLWQNLIITLGTVAIAFLLYKTLIFPVE